MLRPDGQPPHFVSDGSQYLAHKQPRTSSDPREENTIPATRRSPRASRASIHRATSVIVVSAVIPSRPCDTGCFGPQRS